MRLIVPLMKHVDVVIANEEDIQSVRGLSVEGADVISGRLDIDAYRQVAERITRGNWARRWWRSRCAKAYRQATTAGAPCCGTARPISFTAVSATTFVSSIASAAATALPAASSTGWSRAGRLPTESGRQQRPCDHSDC